MMSTFQLDLMLDEPTAMTDGSSDALGHETLGYVPGTSVLGALVAALGVRPSDPLFEKMFLSGSTRFLNAYPCIGGARTLPRPLTFWQGKAFPARVIDALDGNGRTRTDAVLTDHFRGDARKTAKPAFILDSGGIVRSIRREQVHVGIMRETRAAQDGVLFTYESLDAGQAFSGMIVTECDEVAAVLSARVKKGAFTIALGRSRGAGYGAARATLRALPSLEEAKSQRRDGPTTLTLLSDYLPELPASPVDSLRRELADLLGVSSEAVAVQATATRSVRGFRGVWGLPRPVRVALSKGSVFTVDGVASPEALQRLACDGLGSRRNEGFGRIVANWVVHGTKSDGVAVHCGALPDRAKRPASTRGAAMAGCKTAIESRRAERRLRLFVSAALAHESARTVAKNLTRIPPSQLGNLRGAMASQMTSAEVGKWFREMSEKTAGDRWRRAVIGPLKAGDPDRNGIAFVWSSLFGGKADDADHLDGEPNWKSAVELSLCPLVANDALKVAARRDPDRTLRVFTIALVGEVTRERNLMKSKTPQGSER